MGLSASTSRVIVRKYQDEGIIFESKADKEIRLSAEGSQRNGNSTPSNGVPEEPNQYMMVYPPQMPPFLGCWGPNFGWNPMGMFL